MDFTEVMNQFLSQVRQTVVYVNVDSFSYVKTNFLGRAPNFPISWEAVPMVGDFVDSDCGMKWKVVKRCITPRDNCVTIWVTSHTD